MLQDAMKPLEVKNVTKCKSMPKVEDEFAMF